MTNAGLSAAGQAGDYTDDLVVPGQYRVSGLAQPQKIAHYGGCERPGEVTPQLGLPTGSDQLDKPRDLGRDEVPPQRFRAQASSERVVLAGVCRAVQGQHARADNACGGEPRVVYGERPAVLQHLDGQVVAGHQPRIQFRYPAHRIGLPHLPEQRIRVLVEQRQDQHPHSLRGACVSDTFLRQ